MNQICLKAEKLMHSLLVFITVFLQFYLFGWKCPFLNEILRSDVINPKCKFEFRQPFPLLAKNYQKIQIKLKALSCFYDHAYF